MKVLSIIMGIIIVTVLCLLLVRYKSQIRVKDIQITQRQIELSGVFWKVYFNCKGKRYLIVLNKRLYEELTLEEDLVEGILLRKHRWFLL